MEVKKFIMLQGMVVEFIMIKQRLHLWTKMLSWGEDALMLTFLHLVSLISTPKKKI